MRPVQHFVNKTFDMNPPTPYWFNQLSLESVNLVYNAQTASKGIIID